MEQKFLGKQLSKFGYTSGGCPYFLEIMSIFIYFVLLSGSSFCQDHSELDFPHKDEGDAYLQMDFTLESCHLVIDKY